MMVRRSILYIAILLSSYGNFGVAQPSRVRFVDESGKTLAEVEVVTQGGGMYFTIDALRDAFDPNLKRQYNSLTKELILDLKGKQIRLRIGTASATVNLDEQTLSLSRPPLIIAGQPMLPLEFFTELISQAYDFEAFYNPVLQTIHIKEKTDLPPNFPILSSTTQRPKFLVIVDPGHGGRDTGCRGNTGVLEKEVVLNVAKRIEEVCREMQIGVRLTRDADIERRPGERIDIAEKHKGTLFLSLHCNASPSPQAEGIHLYINNPQGELQSARPSTAAGKTSHQSVVINTLSQADFLRESRRFAAALQKELEPLSYAPIPLTEMPIATVSGVYMPAVLVELGYLSNETDEARLIDADNVNSLAMAVSQAIQGYIIESDPVGEAVNGK